MPAISAARPGRASTPIAPDEGVGGGHSEPAVRSRDLRCDKDVVRDWPDNVERAACGNHGTDSKDMSDRLKAEREAEKSRERQGAED